APRRGRPGDGGAHPRPGAIGRLVLGRRRLPTGGADAYATRLGRDRPRGHRRGRPPGTPAARTRSCRASLRRAGLRRRLRPAGAVAGPGLLDLPLGGAAVVPTQGLGVLPRLELLVDVEEVVDL